MAGYLSCRAFVVVAVATVVVVVIVVGVDARAAIGWSESWRTEHPTPSETFVSSQLAFAVVVVVDLAVVGI